VAPGTLSAPTRAGRRPAQKFCRMDTGATGSGAAGQRAARNGRWRIAALVPLFVFVPALLNSVFAFSQGSNMWPIVLIFLAPLGFLYLLPLGLARLAASKRATPGPSPT
jgi:hypothetical protein